MMTADTFVEIAMPTKSGAMMSVRFQFSAGLTYPGIFRAAHANADGSPPTLEQLDGDAMMFDHARRLRAMEEELIRRVDDDDSEISHRDVIADVRSCPRCGGDHDQVRFSPMARAFAPPESAPIVWQRWAPCPVNGDPIMQATVTPA